MNEYYECVSPAPKTMAASLSLLIIYWVNQHIIWKIIICKYMRDKNTGKKESKKKKKTLVKEQTPFHWQCNNVIGAQTFGILASGRELKRVTADVECLSLELHVLHFYMVVSWSGKAMMRI